MGSPAATARIHYPGRRMTTVSTEEALLREVCEHPDDDAPRLIYADWLEDHGRPERAELIRVQCELAGLPDDSPRLQELAAREDSLLEAHATEWHSALPRLPGVEWSEQYKLWRYGFQRGFVVQATFANGRAYRDHAEAAFGATPLEEVRFTRLTARTVKAVAASPLLARLRHLDVGILRAGTVGE